MTPTSDPKSAPTGNASEKDASEKNGTVKLNYFGATWDVVFRDVAEATGSQLVGKRFPQGRFTRRDSKYYTRPEAVRIINSEIERRGFRLVEQDDLLIVMDLPSLRPRYQPAEIQPRSNRPSDRVNQHLAIQPDAPDDAEPRARPAGKRDPSIRPVNHEVQHADHFSGDELTGSDRSATHEPRTVVVFRSRHRPVMDISREIYRAYPDHAELLQSSRDGLPAFRVRQASADTKSDALQFDVTIDADLEEVRIDARKSQADSLSKLFRALDYRPLPNQTRRLLTQPPAVCRIAAQLAPELEALRQKAELRRAAKAQQARPSRDEDDWLAEVDDNEPPPERGDRATEPGDEPDRPRVSRVAPPSLTDIVGNLKSEVVIESIEDLGALIITGRADDVEQVMQVIEQLEELSALTAPRVHLLNLQHVNSEALAQLLTTVYERLTEFPGRATQPRQNVAILPIVKPNAVLIIAPAAELESILDLATELDQPVDPTTEFQVFPLKSAISSQVETLLTEFYEDREGLGTRILIQSDPRSNSVIVRATPRDLDEAAALIKKIDRENTASVTQVRIIELKSASAQELATILNQAIQSVLAPPATATGQQGGFGGGQGAAQISEQFREVKSTVLQFLAVDDEGLRQLRSGVLSDIRITPDPRINALVVAAPERSMRLLEELIKQLDRPSSAVAEIKVFHLDNADATRVVSQLQNLFSTQPQQQQGGLGNQLRQTLGIQVVGAEDAGSSLIPLRFSVDTRTNSIIAIGGSEALGIVEAILIRLDEGDIRERQNAVYRLKNSPATEIASAITQFLTSQQDISQLDPELVSSVEQLEREVVVVAEPVSNSLLISATPRYFQEIQRLIKKLDEAPAQVVIQALLVEVTLDNTDEFGIEFGFQNSVLFDRSVKDTPVTIETTTTSPNGTQTTNQTIISQTATPGFNFANPAFGLGNNINSSPSQMGLQSLSNFSVSRINGDLGFGGLVLSAGSDTVNMLLRALSYSRRIQILSRPIIRTLDNQTAQILQGSLIQVPSGVTLGPTGLANPNITPQQVGIILTVTPRISPDGQIVMDLSAEKSSLRDGGTPIFVDATNGNVIEAPIIDLSNARAVISVPNNQTVVIGGLITSSDDRVTRKVPGLGDIPLLGYLFRYDNVTTNRKELLIFLTPRLIREEADSELIKEVEMARMHFIESEAEEVHGPLHGIPAEMSLMDGEAPWLDVYRDFPQAEFPTIAPPAVEMGPGDPPPPRAPKEIPAPPETDPLLQPTPKPSPPDDSRRRPAKSEQTIQFAAHENESSESPSEPKSGKPKKKSLLPRLGKSGRD